MNYNDHELTKEQKKVVKSVQTGDDTKVQAPAGSGKTFTLEATASKLPGKSGILLTFNKATADDASNKFPGNINCRTGHSIAYGHTGYKFRDRLGHVTGTLVSNSIDVGDYSKYPTIVSKGYQILETLRRFCYSADTKIKTIHTPKLVGPYTEEELPEMKKDLAHKARRLWKLMSNESGDFPVTHDVYLKLWALSEPDLKKDLILLDEAQDSNPVILDVLEKQRNTQKVYVGDKFQQIYGWRGAVNAMAKIDTEREVFLTQSFRFGPQIAEMANNILGSYLPPGEAPPKIIGFDQQRSEVVYTPQIDLPDVLICRTNAGVIANVFWCLEKGISIYIQGGPAQMIRLLKGAQELMNGKKTYVPELVLFSTWDEVVEHSKSDVGQDLQGLVSMIDTYGVQKLINALNSTCKFPLEAEMTLTTAHKAKGLEWKHVKLYKDFQMASDEKRMNPAEVNVLYVAATRALKKLDVSLCGACHVEEMRNAKLDFAYLRKSNVR